MNEWTLAYGRKIVGLNCLIRRLNWFRPQTQKRSWSSNFLQTHPYRASSVSKRIYGSRGFQKTYSETHMTTLPCPKTGKKPEPILPLLAQFFSLWAESKRFRPAMPPNPHKHVQFRIAQLPLVQHVIPNRLVARFGPLVSSLGRTLEFPLFGLPSSISPLFNETSQNWVFASKIVINAQNRPPIVLKSFFDSLAPGKNQVSDVRPWARF